MQELRILNGYHRGATLPLADSGERILGAHEDADVVLADPGILGRHARLALTAGGWTLTAMDGCLRRADTNQTASTLQLAFGEQARADRIWLTVVDQDAPWIDPPPEPGDAPPAPPDEQQDASADDDNPMPHGTPPGITENQTPSPAPAANAPVATDSAAAEMPQPRRARGYRMVLLPLFLATALTGAAAYALTSHPAASDEHARVREDELKRLAALPRKLPAAELEAALRRRLAEVDLLYRVTLELREGAWTIRGAMGDDDAERLQRMLRDFAKAHVIDFPIDVKIGSPESMLPFRIIQVLNGSDPSIVTDDGRRLYVGDEYRGVRLAAVAGNQIKFTGKQALNVSW
ncbi:hypothetical protein J8I26_04320 [Herbaspirillum sp. LeCh32-8]|uniref:FHA domain-containing protein n=1 Tax=Herbaspirillum sp. LeCh32-8 TaxID=2821356 RepID=UPI001AE1B9FC|nr:FHA domain-containing protein [Herbaspirillum sp. LeCh32-8]MBP0597316.1 hypothetical protein [Herbaspirillum sp. LeCh32-8]